MNSVFTKEHGDVKRDMPLLVCSEMLMLAAEDGAPVIFAEIAMRRALTVDSEPESPEPRRRHARKYRIVR